MLDLTLLAIDLTDPAIWIALLTLTFLEIVLGIDNIIFISIAANRLPESERPRATNIGLALAMVLRVVLLFGISYLVAAQSALFEWGEEGSPWHAAPSLQSVILFAGGLFLIYKATTEIHHKLEGASLDPAEGIAESNKSYSSFSSVLVQITLINVVFSFDSILTAIGLTDVLWVMIVAVIISVVIMMLFANPVGRFVNRHPTVQMLGLTFLVLIGFMLIAEGAHLGHVVLAGQEVGAIPKGYLYFAIFFSVTVEFLNMRLRKPKQPVQLHGIPEQAVKEGIIEP